MCYFMLLKTTFQVFFQSAPKGVFKDLTFAGQYEVKTMWGVTLTKNRPFRLVSAMVLVVFRKFIVNEQPSSIKSCRYSTVVQNYVWKYIEPEKQSWPKKVPFMQFYFEQMFVMLFQKWGLVSILYLCFLSLTKPRLTHVLAMKSQLFRPSLWRSLLFTLSKTAKVTFYNNLDNIGIGSKYFRFCHSPRLHCVNQSSVLNWWPRELLKSVCWSCQHCINSHIQCILTLPASLLCIIYAACAVDTAQTLGCFSALFQSIEKYTQPNIVKMLIA